MKSASIFHVEWYIAWYMLNKLKKIWMAINHFNFVFSQFHLDFRYQHKELVVQKNWQQATFVKKRSDIRGQQKPAKQNIYKQCRTLVDFCWVAVNQWPYSILYTVLSRRTHWLVWNNSLLMFFCQKDLKVFLVLTRRIRTLYIKMPKYIHIHKKVEIYTKLIRVNHTTTINAIMFIRSPLQFTSTFSDIF